ncbi:hypothetical protein JXA27_08365 [Aerococcaceae bacterium zg-B36]|uniref:hypothetical protein n=1 Tax=Aerococcaceae bacterium zg-252 TaxID=2796928 RepID=UPI001BD84BA2|nr:hypothetical protein [Aerococcaceae bacterium zg-B36]
MGIFDLFKRKKNLKVEQEDIQTTQVTEDFIGLKLSTNTLNVIEPTNEQINQAAEVAINAFDEFVLLEWRSQGGQFAFIQGIGFGTSYRLEYAPIGSRAGYAYVVEGVSLEDAQSYFFEFAEQHKVNFDASWQWQAIV